MNVRTIAWIAACAATFAVGIAVGRGCAGVETAPGDLGPNGATTTPVVPGPARPAAGTRRTTSTASAAIDASANDEAREAGMATAATDGNAEADFPHVDIEVAWPNGDPATGALVYAYPAGQTSAGFEPSNSRVEGTDPARLHVVARGRYDVGALLGAFEVLATDVELPREGPLRLVFPEPCTVTVRMPERGGPTSATSDDAKYQLRLIQLGETRTSWPGRGETTGGWDGGVVGPPGSTWTANAPRGARCRIEHDARFRVEPEEFTAPADVRVTALARYPVHVRVEFDAPGRRFDRDATIQVTFSREEGSDWKWDWANSVPTGTTVVDAVGFPTLDTEFDRPAGTLRWKGDAVVDGAVDFSGLTEDVATAIVARVRVDPRWEPPRPVPGGADAAGRRGLRIRVKWLAPRDTAQAFVSFFDADGNLGTSSVDENACVTVDAEHPRWAIATWGHLVSDAVRLDDGSSGDVPVSLVEGGYLVEVPATMPPKELGTPEVERADGGPFLAESDGCALLSCDLRAGLVIGPLPPGRVAFRVTLRGHVLAEASADVVAGANTPLVIPRLRAR